MAAAAARGSQPGRAAQFGIAIGLSGAVYEPRTHRHDSKLSNFMQSARYFSVPVTELQ